MKGVIGGFPSAVGAALRGVGRTIRIRWRAVALVAAGVVALDVLLPPLVLSVARAPWTFFTFNPWLKSLPTYLASGKPWSEKLDFLSRVALFWFSADGPYGAPEWGLAVDTADVARFVLTALLIGVYVALWLERRRALAIAWLAWQAENRGAPRVSRGAPNVGGSGGPFRGPPGE